MATLPLPITELVTLKLKKGITGEDAKKQSQELIQSTFQSVKGFLGIKLGGKMEDKSVLHWLIKWDTIDSHEAFMSTPTYGPFISQITSFSEPSLIHASVQAPSTPCIEWVTVTLKPETDKQEWVKGLDALKEVLGERQISAGWVTENERAFVVLIGWENKEEHMEWKGRLSEQEVTKAMAMFRSEGVSRVDMCHVGVEQRL